MIAAKKAFFGSMADQGIALTYDDVRMRTAPGNVSAGEVSLASRFSRNVELKVPVISAAMDTVTTSDMAIAVAKYGGIGVIHAGLPPEEQAEEVRRVKMHLNGLIKKPVTVRQDQSLASVLQMCEQQRFDFRTFPVVDNNGLFVGLLTQNDFDFTSDLSTKVGTAMTGLADVVNASRGMTVARAYEFMKTHKKKTLPLINKDGTVAGLYVFSDVQRLSRGNPEQYNVDSSGRLRVAAAVPTDDEAIPRVAAMRKHLDVVVVDSAQGDSKFALQTLKKLKKRFPNLDVIVGNVSEAPSAELLAKAGADGIKVGQGPGSICTTRVETGIGCPQVTAGYQCAAAVRRYGIPVCADGGISNAGDVSIAIAAGAHSVMIGNKLAGTKEAPGDVITLENGSRVKLYRGMGSPSAMRESAASRKRYGATGFGEPLAEGVESHVPYRGPVAEVLDHTVKALRKSMAYVGAKNIESHRQNTMFWRITNAGFRESHPHDVTVLTK